LSTRILYAWRNRVNRLLSDCLDYGILIGKPCKYGMYPMDPRDEEWGNVFLTSEGHVFIKNYAEYDQDKYCMDIFYNKSESDHNFHLFICFDKPETNNISVRYTLFLFFSIVKCVFDNCIVTTRVFLLAFNQLYFYLDRCD